MKTLIANNVTFILLLLVNSFSFSQTNLVPNPSFEKLENKPKKVGELFKAAPWVSPTQGTADIFSRKVKSDEIGIPLNVLGEQKPRTGDNYAGVIFYSKKTNSTREYIQVELISPLEIGKVYCVEYYVSLADFSKYAIDRLGAHFSKNKIAADNWEPLSMIPQVTNHEGKIITEFYEWELICGEYTAMGDESYMTIGNFFLNDQTKIQRMKKPIGLKGTQNDYGYYYIDDVSVVLRDSVGPSCDCEAKMNAGKVIDKMNYVYSKVTGEEEESLMAEDAIEAKSIYFQAGKADITPASKSDLELVLKLMKETKNLKIEVIGYADTAESLTDSTLAENRSQKIVDFLVGGGIKEERLIPVKGSAIGIKESKDEAIKAQNRKVEFAIIFD